MKVLHICSDYPYSKLYQNLIYELDKQDISQIIYIPTHDKSIIGKNALSNLEHTQYMYSTILKQSDKVFYYKKINKMQRDLTEKINLKNIDYIHAHFLFSNGGVAYNFKKRYKINYMVAIRNTDVNLFFKYGIHLRNYGVQIMKEAKNIIFLSPSYCDYVINTYVPVNLQEDFKKKSKILPNGIDPFWITNTYVDKKEKRFFANINLIYVGEFTKNKNVIAIIKVADMLKSKGYNVKLRIIGKGVLKDKIIKLSKKSKANIIVQDYIKDQEILKKLYREADIFIMPSYKETFGLVYIEAMSQGLPIIYTSGQGVDGYYKEGYIGYPVNPNNISDITFKIEKIINNYNNIYPKCIEVSKKFKWEEIAKLYINLYKNNN